MREFSIKQARAIVADLFERRRSIYWVDFLLTVAVLAVASHLYLRVPVEPGLKIICYVITVILAYRAAIFMHEVAHLPRGEMKGFKVAYELLIGIPMMVPSFLYKSHLDHHRTRHYGTHHDGEYLPLSRGFRDVAKFLAQILYVPILVFLRFLFVVPVSLLHPRLRRWVLEHWSSFVINLDYKREITDRDPVHLWLLLDIACFLRIVAALVFIAMGWLPWYILLMFYSIAVATLTLNHVRTLAAHRYKSDGHQMTLNQQVMDSTDIIGVPVLTEIVCPLGLRYHALHHLFPGMPYHNLGTAHQRLMQQLPSDSPYRECAYPGITAVLRELFDAIREQRQRAVVPQETRTTGTG
ncbi:MAG: fatty acid desaturase family protein [Pirellulaceae bacterium]